MNRDANTDIQKVVRAEEDNRGEHRICDECRERHAAHQSGPRASDK